MLSLMRKNAGSWIIKGVLFAIVVVFMFWGVGSFQSSSDTQVAKVNGENISYEQYRKSYGNLLEQYRRAYGGQLSEEMLQILQPKETALNQLIERMILMQEADRLNIRVADNELDEAIRNIPAFQVEGVFNVEHATRLLAMNNYSIDEFRRSLKEDLRITKLRGLVLEGIFVTEDEIRRWYDWYNTEINLEYLNFAPERFSDITLSADEIKAYFDVHRDNYRTEPQTKVRYLQLKPEEFSSQVKVSDEEIARYYETYPNEFRTEKTVEARHILLRVDSSAEDQEVALKKELAEKIQAMAQESQNFAELAKQYSEDSTRDEGGYLGAFSREMMVKPFADQAFSMQAGEVSPPVRTQFGWHIIKVEKINEARTEDLASASDGIRSRLIAEKARAAAREKAETIYDNVFDGDDLLAAAQTYDLTARTTGFFTRGNPPEEVDEPERFADVAFGLEKMVLSELLELGDGIYLMQVIDRIASEVPPFESVAEKVKTDLYRQRQDERARSEAEVLLAEVAQGTSLSEAAEQRSLTLDETGLFKRTGSIPQLGYEPEIVQSAFKLTAADPLHEAPLKANQGWYVIRLKERRLPDAEGFQNEKDMLSNQLDINKKQSAEQQWMADLKARSQIETNQKLIR
jgi:peptidyl-prolyl cis-trans isomerase D